VAYQKLSEAAFDAGMNLDLSVERAVPQMKA